MGQKISVHQSFGILILLFAALVMSCNKSNNNLSDKDSEITANADSSNYIFGPDSIPVPPPNDEWMDTVKPEYGTAQILKDNPEFLLGDWTISEISGQDVNSLESAYSFSVQMRPDNTMLITENGEKRNATFYISGDEIYVTNEDGSESQSQILFISEDQMIVNMNQVDEHGHETQNTVVFDRP